MSLERLLEDELIVATAGVEILEQALIDQATTIAAADWGPPATGTEDALASLAAAGRTEAANATAIERMLAVRPQFVDVAVARDVIPGMTDTMFLHAGPPLTWDRSSGPIKGAIIGALLYEGMAATAEEAEEIAGGSGITMSPCHHHQTVGPMAGIVSPSMPVAVVRDADGDGVAYSTLNEGLGKVLRYGAYGPEVIERLHWIGNTLGPDVAATLEYVGPIDLRSLIAQALQMGDDGHNRNRAATSLLLRVLGPGLVENESVPRADRGTVFRFIESNDHFMLNLVMAAGKLAVDAASGVEGSSVVTTMARNGTDFGIRLSGTGDRWFTAPAPIVDGLFLGAFTKADANPDIGDSAITETVGLGGFAMAASPAIVGFVGGTASGAVRRTQEMYEITLAEHSAYQIPQLEFRGTPVGIDATLVVRTGVQPQINTGIAHKDPGIGMVGAGLVKAPMQCFADAVVALAEMVQ
jgi:hypothetical protein